MRTQLGPGRFTPRTVIDSAGAFGRLKGVPGVGQDVRCSCLHCGTHVLVAPSPLGHLRGLCPVCGGGSFT